MPFSKVEAYEQGAVGYRFHGPYRLPGLLKPRQKASGLEEPGVRYGTKKRIKGLELKAVVLLHEGAERADSTDRFANYVAATRAWEHLLV